MKLVTGIAALAATTALTACGGSNSGGNVFVEPEVLFAVDSAGETVGLVDAAQRGRTFAAEGADSSGLVLDYGANTVTAASPEVTFRLTEDGGVLATIDGEETVFGPDTKVGEDGFEIEIENTSYRGVFGQNGGFDGLFVEGDRYAGVVSYFVFPEDGNATVTYNVLGARTAVDAIPDGGATYYGYIDGRILPAEDFDSYRTDQVRIDGDLRLDVTMDGRISGVADDIALTYRNDGDDETIDVEGEVVWADTPIVDGAFTGDMTGDDAFVASALIEGSAVGTFAGRFFGPEAEEAAGTLAMSLETEDGMQVGAGYFATEVEN